MATATDRDPCPLDEAPGHLMDLVAPRLQQQFPQADPSSVADAVRRAVQDLDDARVRTFVPILVERQAAAVLEASERVRRAG